MEIVIEILLIIIGVPLIAAWALTTALTRIMDFFYEI